MKMKKTALLVKDFIHYIHYLPFVLEKTKTPNL